LDIYNNENIPCIAHLDNETGQEAPRIIAAFSKRGTRRNIAVNGKVDVEVVDEKGNVIENEKIDIMKDIIRDKKGNPVQWRTDVPKTIDKETKKERNYKIFNKNEVYVEYKKYWFLNFTIASVPWPNQVHHVLNHSSLYKAISAFKNIPDVVAQGLLKELYNINHKNNAIILPTKEKDTRITGLPTHGSHLSYSNRILKEVNKALSGYKKINANHKPGHQKPDPISVEKQLKKISEKWYNKIIDTVTSNKKLSKNKEVIKINDIK